MLPMVVAFIGLCWVVLTEPLGTILTEPAFDAPVCAPTKRFARIHRCLADVTICPDGLAT